MYLMLLRFWVPFSSLPWLLWSSQWTTTLSSRWMNLVPASTTLNFSFLVSLFLMSLFLMSLFLMMRMTSQGLPWHLLGTGTVFLTAVTRILQDVSKLGAKKIQVFSWPEKVCWKWHACTSSAAANMEVASNPLLKSKCLLYKQPNYKITTMQTSTILLVLGYTCKQNDDYHCFDPTWSNNYELLHSFSVVAFVPICLKPKIKGLF